MPGAKLEVPVLSYDDLRRVARDFLGSHHPKGGLPIPIERIIEYELKLDISPEMSLQHICDVDAFIDARCTTIHVDAEVYLSENQNRYRFSLAHETAHFVLHRKVMQQLPFTTMTEWKTMQASIPPDTYHWLEWQAYALGGLILVPDVELQTEFVKASGAVATNPTLNENKDVMRYAVEGTLAEIFSVSREVIQRRCTKNGLV